MNCDQSIEKLMNSLIASTHPQWHSILHNALEQVDKNYLLNLQRNQNWLPGINNLLAAFSLSLSDTRYILLGESPYPRPASANGYAFWDKAVKSLWSEKGLSREVNRATSLRNWIKMLLVARGDLDTDLSQTAIAKLDKSAFYQTGEELFNFLIKKGFLLLNASLVYSKGDIRLHAREWKPFMNSLFAQLTVSKPSVQLLLFGRIAKEIPQTTDFSCLIAEHPYNLSFINNSSVLEFFKPLDLLTHENEIQR
jgi:uracil-DNA glycosylase